MFFCRPLAAGQVIFYTLFSERRRFRWPWSGTIVSIQPRTTVWRYRLDNRTHSHIGYNLFLDGEVNGLVGPFSWTVAETFKTVFLPDAPIVFDGHRRHGSPGAAARSGCCCGIFIFDVFPQFAIAQAMAWPLSSKVVSEMLTNSVTAAMVAQTH